MSDSNPVVVLGSGPAGVAVAEGLLKRGRAVVLIEGGVARERDRDRELSEGDAPRGVWGHDPLTENRRRMLGGTSTAWGGRCIPLDPIDFERREWVPHSGWPISYEEYARWLPEAARLLEIPEVPFARQEPDPILAADGEIDGSPIELWSPPTNTAQVLEHLTRTQPGLTVLQDTNVTGLEIDSGGRVLGLQVRRGDESILIEGSRFVLAAGALENARLLLTSPIAPTLPALGRYYMSHVFASHVAYVGPPLPKATGFFRLGRTYGRHRWQLTADAQRDSGVGNAIGFIARPPAHGLSVHLDPLTALAEAAKVGRRVVRAPRTIRSAGPELAVYGRVLLTAPPRFWPSVAVQAIRRRARHRLPMLLPARDGKMHHLTVQAEHLPHPESRVVLSSRTDRFGVPLLETDVDFHRRDFETIEVFIRSMERFLGRLGYRALQDPTTATRAFARDMFGGFNSNAHHIGTARMGDDPSTSVVDADCRVHGTANLWVAGSAVFPTSGHCNPTLSIVALACRLAEHLAAR